MTRDSRRSVRPPSTVQVAAATSTARATGRRRVAAAAARPSGYRPAHRYRGERGAGPAIRRIDPPLQRPGRRAEPGDRVEPPRITDRGVEQVAGDQPGGIGPGHPHAQ